MKGMQRSLSRGNPKAQEIIKQVFTIENTPVTVTGGSSTNPGTGQLVIGDFPEGNILFLGAVSYIQVAGSGSDANISDTWDGDYGIGTVPNANATLSGTDVDIIGSTAFGAATAEVSPLARGTGNTVAIFDNTDGSLELNLNILTDDNHVTDSTAVTMTVNGTVHLIYSILGDD